jgi:hypothetical protein
MRERVSMNEYVAATLAESRRLAKEATKRLKAERAALERQRRADEAECQERIASADQRLAEVAGEFGRLTNGEVSGAHVVTALAEFDAVWAALKCSEQAEILNFLIESVEYCGESGDVAITFHPTGIRAIASSVKQHEETAA